MGRPDPKLDLLSGRASLKLARFCLDEDQGTLPIVRGPMLVPCSLCRRSEAHEGCFEPPNQLSEIHCACQRPHD